MSSISIVQEHNRFTYVVDTAGSCVVNNEVLRIKGLKNQKTYQMGSDVVFASGETRSLENVRGKMCSLLDQDGHIMVEELQKVLKNEYEPIDDLGDPRRYHMIGFVIMQIVNGKSVLKALKQSYNHFEIKQRELAPGEAPVLSVDGFDNVFFHEKIIENEQRYFHQHGRYYILESILQAYRDHYSEGIGSDLLMYRFDENGIILMHEEHLEEHGLKYLNKEWRMANNALYVININGYEPITKGNIGNQTVAEANNAMVAQRAINADVATTANSATRSTEAAIADSAKGLSYAGDPYHWNGVYFSVNDNFRPTLDGVTSCGTSDGRFSSVWAVNGVIQTSDVNKKNTILDLDERYMRLIQLIRPKSFKMNEGTSGRSHLGFIAQGVETAMIECGITDKEFAGLIKAPVYSKKLLDKEGNELPEYDTTSEIIGYDYGLRYDEFIPLLLARINDQEQRLLAIENALGI